MVDVLALLIEEHTDLKVEKKTWLDSNVIWNSVKNGDIDIYIEYTGTGLVNILKQKPVTDPQLAYDTVKKEFQAKYNIIWLKPFGFNNTYAMAMMRTEAEKRKINTISDLAQQSNQFVLGTEQPFVIRDDALPAMNKLYGTNFKSVKTMDAGLKYNALINGEVDVIDVFSTDGRIPTHDLKILEDDKNLFPPYYAAPLIREEVLQAHPELEGVLNKLADRLTDQEMQKLNQQVELGRQESKVVARKWLQEEGLISK